MEVFCVGPVGEEEAEARDEESVVDGAVEEGVNGAAEKGGCEGPAESMRKCVKIVIFIGA